MFEEYLGKNHALAGDASSTSENLESDGRIPLPTFSLDTAMLDPSGFEARKT